MRRVLAIVVALMGVALGGVAAAQQPVEPFSPAQREAIRAMVREFILQNPEVLIEALEALDARRQVEAEQRTRQALVARREQLLNDPANPVLGNPGGDVTLVEFFDYRCPYCKQMQEPLNELLRSDPRLRFVHIQFPILGPDSVLAARAALASRPQNRYPQFHDALMSARGNLDEAAVMRIATSVGLDVQRLRRDMTSPAVQAQITAALSLAQELGINGTPAFIIGDRLIAGAVDVGVLRGAITRSRQQ